MNRRSAPRISEALADFWHTLFRDLFGSYRPERHYMRGKGPRSGG